MAKPTSSSRWGVEWLGKRNPSHRIGGIEQLGKKNPSHHARGGHRMLGHHKRRFGNSSINLEGDDNGDNRSK